MKIKIRADKVRFTLAVPTALAAWAVKRVPEAAFASMRRRVVPPYDQLITRETVRMMVEACVDILKENKGLEAVHVEAADGTFVSIKL